SAATQSGICRPATISSAALPSRTLRDAIQPTIMNAAYIATTAAMAIARHYSAGPTCGPAPTRGTPKRWSRRGDMSGGPACPPSETLSAFGEDPFSLFAEQDPERADAERGAVRQEQQIDRAERERRNARPRLVLAQRHADGDVRGAPDERNHRERREDDGGETGGDLRFAAAMRRREQRERADTERERRDSDERGQQAPHDEEDAEEIDLRHHSADCGLQIADYAAEARMATRSATRTDAPSGDFRRKRKQAPSATPGGTVTRSSC